METPNPNWFLKARLKTRQLLLLIALDDYFNPQFPEVLEGALAYAVEYKPLLACDNPVYRAL